MSVLATMSTLSPDDKKLLVNAGIGLLQSAPVVAIGAILAGAITWNLEHLAIGKCSDGRYRLRRLSTQDTSNLRDKDLTPLGPPIMSTAMRLADAGADTAEAAFQLAQRESEGHAKGGLISDVQRFIFGG